MTVACTPRLQPLWLALFVCVALQAGAGLAQESVDPMLDGDPNDPATGLAAEIMPSTPWIQAGPDGVYGTADDDIDWTEFGDIDIVIRAGEVDWSQGIPKPTPRATDRPMPAGVAEPFGHGIPIPFTALRANRGVKTETAEERIKHARRASLMRWHPEQVSLEEVEARGRERRRFAQAIMRSDAPDMAG